MNTQRRIATSQPTEAFDLEIDQPFTALERASSATAALNAGRGIDLELTQEHEEQRFALERNAARRRSSGHMLRNKDFQ